jgi:hypothetical protein
MSTLLKINLEIPGPSDRHERQALTDTIKAIGRVLGEAWPTIREVEEVQDDLDDLIGRLGEIINQRGAGNVAIELKVSPAALKGWLRGVRPTEANRKRIAQFLSSQSAPTDAARVEQQPRESSELFGKQPARPEAGN